MNRRRFLHALGLGSAVALTTPVKAVAAWLRRAPRPPMLAGAIPFRYMGGSIPLRLAGGNVMMSWAAESSNVTLITREEERSAPVTERDDGRADE